MTLLGKNISPEMLQKIKDWGQDFADPAKFGEQILKLYEKKDDIKDIMHEIHETIK